MITANLISYRLALALIQACLSDSLAHTPATVLACCGGFAIALVALTGWAWVGAVGAGLLVASAAWLHIVVLVAFLRRVRP